MTKARRFQYLFALALVAPALGCLTLPARAAYTFTRLVTTQGFLDALRPPAVNNNGQVAFFAYRDDGGTGIYRADGQGVTTIAEISAEGFVSFEGCGNYVLVNAPDISDAGWVVFTAYHYDDGLQDCWEALYTGSGGAVTPITAEWPAAGVHSDSCNATIGTGGLIAFRGREVPGDAIALYQTTGGAPSLVLAESAAIGTFSDPDVNGLGQMTFAAYDPSGKGIFLCQAGTPVCVAREGVDFYTLSDMPAISSNGRIAFRATANDFSQAVCLHEDSTRVVADDRGDYRGFGDPSVNSTGTVVFWARLDDWRRGIFYGPDPSTDRVITDGDTLFGSSVSYLQFGRHGLNESGQVAFYYELDSGEYGIALATPQAPIAVDPATAAPMRAQLEFLPVSPNPSRGPLRLAWRTQRDGADPSLDVFAPSGRLVRHLTGASGKAGEHTVLWDGRDDSGCEAASGVYWARLAGAGSAAAVRFVLIR